MPYNPRAGQYGSSLGGSDFADTIRRIREATQRFNPMNNIPKATIGNVMDTRVGPLASTLGIASTPDVRPVNPMSAFAPKDQTGAWAPNAPSVPISDTQAAPAPAPAPSAPMPPVQGLDLPWMPPMPRPRPQDAPQASSIPMPMARPAEAPQAPPDTSFFMRNALMMQDPNGGGFIDPTGAASVSGPDLIQKMMGYLHQKV